MGNSAILMKRLGHEVCGSDRGIYEPMKSALSAAGVECLQGWNPDNIKNFAPDCIVVGNAISRMNPELEFALADGSYELTSLPQAISSHLIGRRKSLVVSGTHGKTTTTSLAAFILRANGVDTGWLIGGVPQDFPEGGANLGSTSAPFVIEGDEYDSAYFDKRSKFIHYKPYVLIINNIEFDHADIFRDIYDVKRTFSHVRRIVSPLGLIIENADDANIASLEPTPWTRRVKVGFSENADLKIKDFVQHADGSSFTLECGGICKRIEWAQSGQYNARNAAMAAAGAAAVMGLDNLLGANLDCLKDFQGVKRRQQIIARGNGIVAIEDFGHHPTAISLTLDALRQRFKGYKIFAAFEPRSNTARTNVFEGEFASALRKADKAYVGKLSNADKIPADRRMDTAALAALSGIHCRAFEDNLELLKTLKADAAADDCNKVVVFFSNGSFDSIHKLFAADIPSR